MASKGNTNPNDNRSKISDNLNDSGLKAVKNINDLWTNCLIHDTLYNNLSDCIIVYKGINNGNDFILLDLNKSAEITDKLKKEDVAGKSVLEVFPGLKEFGLFDIFRRVYQTGLSEHHPLHLYRDNRISGWRQNFVFKIPKQDIIISIYRDITEEQKTLNEIINMSKFPEEDPYPVLRVNSDFILTYANPGSIILLSFWKININDKVPYEVSEAISLALAKNKHSIIEIDCNEVIYSLVIAPVIEGKYVNIYGRDVTFRKKIEDDLRKANRMYALISQINQTIIRVDDEKELFRNICRVTLQYGKFDYAWIGLVDKEKNCIVPLEYSGEEGEFLSSHTFSLDKNTSEGQGPSAKAVRERKIIVSNNISEDPARDSIEDNILTQKYLSAAAVPFFLNNEVKGIIGVFTNEKNFFNHDEIELLNEVSMDISFALSELKLKEEKRLSDEKLIETEERQRKILEEMPVAAVSCDLFGNIQFINNIMLVMVGSPSIEFTKQINLLNFEPLNAIGFSDAIKKSISTRKKVIINEWYNSRWGKNCFYQCHFLPISDENKKISSVLILSLDLTNEKLMEINLTESQTEFKTVTEEAPYPISIFDKNNTYTYFNPKFIKTFGYTLEEIPTREKWFDLAYPDSEYRKYIQSKWQNLDKSKRWEESEIFNVSCKDKSVRQVIMNIFPLKNDKFLLYYLDLTDLNIKS